MSDTLIWLMFIFLTSAFSGILGIMVTLAVTRAGVKTAP